MPPTGQDGHCQARHILVVIVPRRGLHASRLAAAELQKPLTSMYLYLFHLGCLGSLQMLSAVQASDFVQTPLAEDQGAITKFFNGNQAQTTGGSALQQPPPALSGEPASPQSTCTCSPHMLSK